MTAIKVTVGLVPFGGVKYLPYSLASLLDQDYEHIEYLILDQEEGEYSATKWVEKHRPEWLSMATWLEGPNLMHSGGMNALINKMSGDVFIGVSQDMIYPKDFVSKVVSFLQAHGDYDFATARLYYWDFNKLEKTNRIDSLGLKIDQKHSSFEIGQGKIAESFSKTYEEIFGVSGALFAIRRKALEKIKVNDQFFDENLHYKNDVDLSYRLQWAGYRGALINNIIIHHDRFINNKAKKPFWVIRQSLFGDWVCFLKNYSWQYSFVTHCKTLIYLSSKTIFSLICHPSLFGVFGDLWKKRVLIAKWRKAIPRAITAKQMEKKLEYP